MNAVAQVVRAFAAEIADLTAELGRRVIWLHTFGERVSELLDDPHGAERIGAAAQRAPMPCD